ncbi:MAG: ThiF family adenylyltransferase [Bdellovibrionota bacterium]
MQPTIAKNDEDLYYELFKRNQPVIRPSLQEKLKNLRLFIAGCGSTGGAFIEGASRLGVLGFRLTEPDHYELHNLNRQFVYPGDVGANKAIVHAERLKKLFKNCKSEVEVETSGINESNIDRLLDGISLVFDAVDVTTVSGMKAKFLLHERAASRKLMVLSAFDLGFKQWIRVFDYRLGGAALDGRLDHAKTFKNPLRALVEGFCPLEELSVEISEELLRMLQNPNSSACQLATACHLLAAFTAPLLIRFCDQKSIPNIVSFDLMRHLETESELAAAENKRLELQKQIEMLLKTIA